MQRLTRHLLLPFLLLLLALALTACGGTEEQTPDVPDVTDPSATGESDPTGVCGDSGGGPGPGLHHPTNGRYRLHPF